MTNEKGRAPIASRWRARVRRWALRALVPGAAIAGCTAINDVDDFVIEPPQTGIDSVYPTPAPSDDCRRGELATRCTESGVPQRCSATGQWEDTGPACELGCSEGACFECTPTTGTCTDTERSRLQCSDAGRWVNAEPCGLDSPHCVGGACLECLPLQRTCIGDVPQSCGSDGRWRAETPCPEGQSCVPGTGECHACALGEVRSCRDARGNCAAGVSTCEPDGSWSACSVLPGVDDCDIPGDDASCDGIPNSPPGGCGAECSADVACGPADSVGICRTGVSRCSGGALQACEGVIWPQPRDCRSRDDNDCNGIADYLDDTCACDATDATPEPCPTSLYDDTGSCERQVRTCLVAPGGTTSYWSECWGGLEPERRDCRSHDDNDCDGTPDDESAECECREGAGRLCSAGGCDGQQRCIRSPSGDATFWGECELPSRWLFSEPERLSGLGLSGELWGPAPVPPEARHLLFSASDPEHIYVAERVAGDTVFGPAVLLASINGMTTEGTPFVTASGQTLYFDSRRRGDSGRDLWRARATVTGWGTPELVPNVNSTANDLNAWVSPDEQRLVFNSDRSGDMDLWEAVRDGETRGAPRSLDALNSAGSDEGATLTRDGLTIFFASNRPGGNGGLDLWVATRPTLDDEFSTPTHLGGVNGSEDELDPALGPDGSELFFSSSRGGVYELYRARRGCGSTAALGAR